MRKNVSEHASSKNGFPHFMLKEIYEQPDAMQAIVEGCINGSGRVTLPGFAISPEEIRRFTKITIAASGSSRHAGILGEFMLERMTGLPVEVDFASQYCYRDPIVGPNELTIFISQSGTTIDTIAALHEARRKGSKSLAICNVPETPLTRDADATLLTYAGEEVEQGGIGIAGKRRLGNVADSERFRPLAAGFVKRCDGIDGSSGLRDKDGKFVRPNNRIAVAVLAGKIHFYGKAGHALQHELADNACVPA